MAKVYTFPKSSGEISTPQEFGLVKLIHGIVNHDNPMVRDGHCYVTGIRFVHRADTDYEQILAAGISQLKKFGLKEEQMQRAISALQDKEFLTITTPFHAMRYTNTDETPMADGCPYQGFVTDLRNIGIIHFDTKEIAIAPFGDKRNGPHRNLFYDAVGAKLAGSRWQYDGNLVDSLKEFGEDGYSFNEGRHPDNLREVVDLNLLKKPVDRRYITIRPRIKLEDVLSLIA